MRWDNVGLINEGTIMDMKAIKDAAIIEQLRMNAYASIRIAKAIEEILRLIKKDMGIK